MKLLWQLWHCQDPSYCKMLWRGFCALSRQGGLECLVGLHRQYNLVILLQVTAKKGLSGSQWLKQQGGKQSGYIALPKIRCVQSNAVATFKYSPAELQRDSIS